MNWRGILLAGVLCLLAFNATVFAPVAMALDEDDRNGGFTMVAYRAYGLHPTDITVDLIGVERAAPIDLYRGLFQAAAAFDDRRFGSVTLARQGRAVFRLSGDDFHEIGRAYDLGENPVYMIRTLPEKLLLPDGAPAYGTWTGGVLGVLSAQMEDVNDAAQTWAGDGGAY